MPSSPRLTIGPWLADPVANELARDGETVRIEPKMMEVLAFLAAQPGEVVARDDMLETLWPEVVVSEDALSGTISKLRRVLGDDPRAPSYIETIPRTGYRLVAPVAVVEAKASAVSPTPGDSSARIPKDRAVLLATFLGAAAIVLTLALLARQQNQPDATLSVRPLTRAAGIERYPALDPAGQRLAFAARARDSTFYHLFVQNLEAETPLQLTRERSNDVAPVWSRDGQTLAFLRCRALRCHVYTTLVPGGVPRRRAERTVSPYGLAWADGSPDGDAVIVVDRDTTTAPYQLLRLDLATGKRHPLTAPPDGALGDLAPSPSPDGTIAFVRHDRSGGEDLYLLPTDGPAARLTHEQVRIRGLAWSADGRSLLFSTRREGTIGLWRVPATGGPLERAAAPSLRDPGALAVGERHTVVESWNVEVNLWEATRTGDTPFQTRPLVVSSAADREPALAPDGSRIAFVSDRSGTPELWVAQREGTAPLRLTDFGGTGLGAPAWLPDGQRIVFEVQRDGQASIYITGADGGMPRPLTDAEGYDVAPRPSRDGRWVYFGSDRSGDWEVWKTSVEGGTTFRVTDVGGFAAQESPDGATLYFTKYFEPGLWAMPTGVGPARLVTDALGALDWGNWAATEAGVFWVDRSQSGARVLRLDPDTGEVETAFAADDVPVREVGLTATPDGQTLVVAQTERVESDLFVITPTND